MHLQQYPEFAIHRAKRWLNSKRGIEWAVSRQTYRGLKDRSPEKQRAVKLANRLGPPSHIWKVINQFKMAE